MNFYELSIILRYLAVALAVFVLSYLLLFKERKTALVFFGLFMVSYVSPNISYILNNLGLREHFPNLKFIPVGFYYFCMPLFYLYTKSLLEQVKKKEIIICLIPGVLEFLFMLTLFVMPYETSSAFHKSHYWLFFIIHGVLLNVFSLFFVSCQSSPDSKGENIPDQQAIMAGQKAVTNIQFLTKQMEEQPSANLYYLRAKNYLALHAYGLADQDMENALRDNPGEPAY